MQHGHPQLHGDRLGRRLRQRCRRRLRLVRDFRFFVTPHAVGGGTRALPPGIRLGLNLVEHHVFGNGMALLHYRQA